MASHLEPTSEQADFSTLVTQACNQDQAAATELVRRYESELRRLIRYELTNPAIRRLFDTMDVYQSVMAGFFHRLVQGEIEASDPAQVFGLLRVMARHKVADKAKYVLAVKRYSADAGLTHPARALDLRPGPLETRMQADFVERVAASLPQELRPVLERWMAGFEWKEIADEFGGNADTWRKRFDRAMRGVQSSIRG